MGSSLRQDFNNGSIPEWEWKIKEAAALIREVIESSYAASDGESQFDNASDDGAFRERLKICVDLLKSELPPQSKSLKQVQEIMDKFDAFVEDLKK